MVETHVILVPGTTRRAWTGQMSYRPKQTVTTHTLDIMKQDPRALRFLDLKATRSNA